MGADIRERLKCAALEPSFDIDVDDLHERARRTHIRNVAAAAALTMVVLVAGTALVVSTLGSLDPIPLAVDPDPHQEPPPDASEGLVEFETRDGRIAAELVLSAEVVPSTIGLTATVANHGDVYVTFRDLDLERWDGEQWTKVQSLQGIPRYRVSAGERSPALSVGYAGPEPLVPGWYAIRTEVHGRYSGDDATLRARFRVTDAVDGGALSPIVVTASGTGPDEPGLEPDSVHVDIVTEPGDFEVVWRRFRLDGNPPSIDHERFSLLFVAFVPLANCPEVLRDVRTAEDHVAVQFGTVGDTCASVGFPVTFVIAVDRRSIPNGVFHLELLREGTPVTRFALAGAPQSTPPDGPDVVADARVGAGYELVGLGSEPQTATRGMSVEISGHNESAVPIRSEPVVVLEYWDEQRWRPLPGQSAADAVRTHPAVRHVSDVIDAGERAALFEVRTEGLSSNWYALRVRLLMDGHVHTRRVAFRLD